MQEKENFLPKQKLPMWHHQVQLQSSSDANNDQMQSSAKRGMNE